MKLFRKIITLYFLFGAIISYAYYIYAQPDGNFVFYLKPNLIATFIFCIYVIASFLYFKNFDKIEYKNSFSIILLLQSLQLELKGYIFKNFYLPNLSFNLDLNEISNSSLTFDYFSLKIVNGYFSNNSGLLVSINIVSLIILFLLNYSSNTLAFDKRNSTSP